MKLLNFRRLLYKYDKNKYNLKIILLIIKVKNIIELIYILNNT